MEVAWPRTETGRWVDLVLSVAKKRAQTVDHGGVPAKSDASAYTLYKRRCWK